MRKLGLLAAVIATLVAPSPAGGHPLGNFTVNRFSEVVLSGERVYVHYALDLAEIPTFQERGRVRAPGFAARIASGLVLELDGRRVPLRLLEHRSDLRPGAGSLNTLRFDAVYEVRGVGRSLELRDTNYAGRIGWREIVIRAERGARVIAASAPAESLSDGLRSYPTGRLRSPAAVSSARAKIELGSAAGIPPALGENAAPARRSGGFESLVDGELTPAVVLVALALALFWGAAHALSPGHGKAIVAAYLVGTRGTARHALVLGLTVTVTHTIGVFALGLVALALSQFVVPEQLYPWLNLVSGLLVIAVGVAVLRARVRERAHSRTHAHGHAGGHHDHDHDHHSHALPADRGWRSVIGVGISGGILPCPTALVVLLAAVSLHRVGYGLLLIVAFSVGLAGAVTAMGLLAVSAKRFFSRMGSGGRAVRLLPALSALVVLALGVAMTLRALPSVT